MSVSLYDIVAPRAEIGDMLYFNGNYPSLFKYGTPGLFLKTNGYGEVPTWDSISIAGIVAGGDLSGTYPDPTVIWTNGEPTYDLRYTPLTRNINTTSPLSGGGDLSSDRTLTTSMSTNKLIGRGTAGTGVMEEITLGSNLSLSGTTLNATGGTGTVTSVAANTGTSGTDFNITGSPITSSGTFIFNLPDASATARGVITTGTQTIAGDKTFTGSVILSGALVLTQNSNGASGSNADLNTHPSTNVRLVNSGLVSLASISTSGVITGHQLWIHNDTGNSIIVIHNYGSAPVGSAKIETSFGTNINIPNQASVMVEYDSTDGAWKLVNNIGFSSASYPGYLSSTDWSTFNSKVGGSGTSGEVAAFTGAGTPILTSLTTATYPSLTEFSYVKGVTSSLQTQINAKGSGTVTSVSVTTANGISGTVATSTTTPAISLTLGAITPTSVNGTTSTEIGYVSGVTSAIQTQLNAKQATITTGTTAQYLRGNLTLATTPTTAYSILQGVIGATVGAGLTRYNAFDAQTMATLATEVTRQVAIPVACTLSNFYVTMTSAQPASGTMVITIRKNAVNTALTVTIPISTAAGAVVADTTHLVSFAAGDLISIEFVNNASANSGTMSVSCVASTTIT